MSVLNAYTAYDVCMVKRDADDALDLSFFFSSCTCITNLYVCRYHVIHDNVIIVHNFKISKFQKHLQRIKHYGHDLLSLPRPTTAGH